MEEKAVEQDTDHEGTSSVEGVLELLESCQVNQRSRLPRLDPRLDAELRSHHYRQLDEPDRPYRPRKSHCRKKLPHHARKHQTTRRTPTSRDPQCQRPLLIEVRTQHRQDRTKHQPVRNAHTKSLSQEKLHICFAE